MKSNICKLMVFISLLFGIVSCSSDKKSEPAGQPSGQFDFYLRVFSHDQAEQQLSSFGNSFVRLNDYVTLYSGENPFPVWTLENVKNHKIDGLKQVKVHVTCLDEKNQKLRRVVDLNKQYFKVFEVLPELILFDSKSEVSCEFVVTGIANNKSELHIAKMVDVTKDVSNEFRIFQNVSLNPIYTNPQQFAVELEKRNLVKTDKLNLICKTNDSLVETQSLLANETTIQTLKVDSAFLNNKEACIILSEVDGTFYLSESFVFRLDYVQVIHTQFSPTIPNDENKIGENIAYTFHIKNIGPKEHLIKVNPSDVKLTCEDYRLYESKRYIYPCTHRIDISKPFTGDTFSIMPGEVIELKVILTDVSTVYNLRRITDKSLFNDVSMSVASTFLRIITDNSVSAHYVPLAISVNNQLRDSNEAARKRVRGGDRFFIIKDKPFAGLGF